jgi:hypothetical protein
MPKERAAGICSGTYTESTNQQMGAKSKYNFRNRFRYKNGDCVENDYYAVSVPSGASDCRDYFVSRCRITPVPLGRSGSDRRAFCRVTGADLANLANLRLRAEAQYSPALLHSPRPLLMTQVSTSEGGVRRSYAAPARHLNRKFSDLLFFG